MALLFATACNAPDQQVATHPPVPKPRVAVHVLYQNDRLGFPTWIERIGQQIFVADRQEIHAIDLVSGGVRLFGGRGEGPGEFAEIAGLTRHDSLLIVLDRRLRRLTWLDDTGSLRESRPTSAWGNFGDFEPIRLRAVDTYLLLLEGKGVVELSPEGQEYTVVRLSFGGPESEEVATVLANPMINADGIIVPRNPYGPRPLVALARDGRIAVGNGLDRCVPVVDMYGVHLYSACSSQSPRIALPDPDPDAWGVELSPGLKLAHQKRLQHEELSKFKNSIEGLLFDEMGNLWMRAVPDSRYSTLVRDRFAELRPDEYVWEVLDRRGALVAQVSMPGRFSPKYIDATGVYGVLELDTGELVVGHGDLPTTIRQAPERESSGRPFGSTKTKGLAPTP